MRPAERIAQFKPYFFAELGKRINKLRAEGKDVIRMDMGSPDLPPADEVIEALVATAKRPDTHGYTLGSGTQPFRTAIAEYYSRRYGVELNPVGEVMDLIGSKEGLFILSQVMLNPGDVSLVPDPAYSVYAKSAEIAGGQAYAMPLLAENGFLPDLDAIPVEILQRAKILWLNYPNNPTGAIADLAYYEKVIALARKYEILVASDNPYSDVGFNGYRAPSLLEVEGAKEVAVEFNSLSKTFNMAGWRLGMVVGNSDAVGFIETYKSQQDSAGFSAVMAAGMAAMHLDEEWIDTRNRIYQERRDAVLDGLHAAGLRVQSPQAALYIWVPVPTEESSMDFCARLLTETGVSVTPGSVFGKHGEGYLRISLVSSRERLQEGAQRMADWLQKQN
jgi:LL-diaminopimelate aminotransferase